MDCRSSRPLLSCAEPDGASIWSPKSRNSRSPPSNEPNVVSAAKPHCQPPLILVLVGHEIDEQSAHCEGFPCLSSLKVGKFREVANLFHDSNVLGKHLGLQQPEKKTDSFRARPQRSGPQLVEVVLTSFFEPFPHVPCGTRASWLCAPILLVWVSYGEANSEVVNSTFSKARVVFLGDENRGQAFR